ncbi:MAG: hypothetical protein Q7V04_03500 [Deltaproteobacteria bacterium]|nr:hypothetical protein [Deltaproteobacteria bacterium]
MKSSEKFRAEGPFEKLESAFKEIFLEADDNPTLKAEDAGEVIIDRDNDKWAKTKL